mgnify:CR=1 FL=1|jgi:hypothetical protein|tara:strand:+ start:1520 stop:1900 length:381 start_codon:yes stop_codon:yes gene_type:complete
MPPKKSEIEINGKQYIVEAKGLTFFDVQAVAPVLASGSLDFSNYWRHAFTRWLDFYDVKDQCAEHPDIENLSPEAGQQLAALLPEPSQVMEWLVFREAKSAASNTSFTGGLWSTDFATNEKGWSTF